MSDCPNCSRVELIQDRSDKYKARAEKAEAQAEKLSKHINKFQKSSCMDAGCCPDDIANCAECIIKYF